MPTAPQNLARVRREYEAKRQRAEAAAASASERLCREIPELARLDRAIADTCASLVREIVSGKEIRESVERLRSENLELQESRAQLLKRHGYPADYTEVKYECSVCSDTGYIGTKMCRCMKEALILAEIDSSGIGHLIKKCSFDNFDLSYYQGSPKILERMKNIFDLSIEYAENFGLEYENILMMGNTGLGKTHLTTAIARRVIEQGHHVVYDTAQNVFSAFEQERFSGRYADHAGRDDTGRYLCCDLLIIDDLGTELTNQFTISALYHIINSRLNAEKAMILNTNLTRDELRKRYDDRITSRLFGEFQIFPFEGKDIREQKLR